LTEPTSETIAPAFSFGAIARVRRTGDDLVAELERHSVLARLRRFVGDGDDARDILAPRRAGDRRADQADSDQRQAVEERRAERRTETFAHGRPPAMNAASAATTPRFASSTPTVMRKQSGRP
jgi:hypothetical protein